MELTKKPEINEVKKPEAAGYRDIKPESQMSPTEARNFLIDQIAPSGQESASDKKGPCDLSENKKTEEIDGIIHHYDDNGNLYRKDNELLGDNKFVINDYSHKTDSLGRTSSVEGHLRIKDRSGRLPIKDTIEDIGKGDQKDGDQRGHLIGDQFDGSNNLENLTPQDANINQGDYRLLENQLAKEVRDGKEVYVTVEPIYIGNSRRPDKISYTYSINGEESNRIFPNSKEE